VIQKATDILSGIASSPVQRNRLVLTLSAERGHSYRLEAGGNLYAQGALVIEEEELSDIIDESKDAKDINQYPLWENLLRRIGRPLSKQIIETNVDLVRFLTELTGTTRTIEVCFDVSRDLHSAVLEALLEPAEASRPGWKSERERNFWMLKAPIYRRLFQGTGSTRSALFQVRNPPVVNCLVVESDVDGIVRTVRDSSGDPLSLRSLPNVRQEAEWLAQELPRIVGKSINVQRVNDEQARAEGLTLRELVMRTLTSGTEWHLIHYAGHCYFDARQAKAYLFFPNHPYIDALELGEFSTWLRDARFVYLSGCDSSEEEFVYELATNAVPAAFGFRWKIEDDLAIEFTKSFYKSLFLRTKSLEYALLEARREMRSLFKERRVWAAPLLMMQTNQNSTVAYSASGPQRLARAMTA
jgi:hypothetical protein